MPMRSVFCGCKSKTISEHVDNLLLLSGGTDALNLLDCILECIPKKEYKCIDVICGIYYSKYEQLCEKYRTYENVHIHKAVTDIEKYMQKADLAVSAGGTTLYELCAVGTPVISYAFVDNQLDNVIGFAKDEVIDYAGDARVEDVAANVNRYLAKYKDNQDLRQEKSALMQQLVDGRGALRLAKAMKELSM